MQFIYTEIVVYIYIVSWVDHLGYNAKLNSVYDI